MGSKYTREQLRVMARAVMQYQKTDYERWRLFLLKLCQRTGLNPIEAMMNIADLAE